MHRAKGKTVGHIFTRIGRAHCGERWEHAETTVRRERAGDDTELHKHTKNYMQCR